MRKIRKRQKGQAIVEYIIIIVIVAIAGLTVLGFMSDTIRQKVGGIISALGGTPDGADLTVSDGDSLTSLQALDDDGSMN